MTLQEFAQGSTILVDKPLHWTSFDVVKKLRWQLKQQLGVKKIKVGHAGTLDPLATGLLVICIGKHTKKIEGFMGGQKEYTGKFLLGKTTPSYDLESDFDEHFSVENITKDDLQPVKEKLTGTYAQYPPIFSAKQIDGKRAYELARKGEEVKLSPKEITVNEFEIDSTAFPEIAFKIKCSKGTYIRSVAHDFGKELNNGATLIELRRTASGNFFIENAKTVEEWVEYIQTLTKKED